MPTSLSPLTPVTHLSSTPLPTEAPASRDEAPALARVIEIGEVAAGIAVPEDRGVRFFSASRDFDGLDGALFGSSEQAARAVRALRRPGSRRLSQPVAV
ncbi:hypothetical protein [Methylobacterium aerolatum]|uniref:Uncharacterized protein n=1 Tax=Methylobacterium aerolatum TaxID=418708 RepID=A0ABU0HYR6_9HYPH|nr:hypothetical protein [Methylobacterium aerolatum]MDQ0447487.1 hypothetical protein [Methylobacterium aerolatum]GJD34588.1 hypothetical protein FMGBMHLM_1490 [Methylobacterium aerolatum]